MILAIVYARFSKAGVLMFKHVVSKRECRCFYALLECRCVGVCACCLSTEWLHVFSYFRCFLVKQARA